STSEEPTWSNQSHSVHNRDITRKAMTTLASTPIVGSSGPRRRREGRGEQAAGREQAKDTNSTSGYAVVRGRRGAPRHPLLVPVSRTFGVLERWQGERGEPPGRTGRRRDRIGTPCRDRGLGCPGGYLRPGAHRDCVAGQPWVGLRTGPPGARRRRGRSGAPDLDRTGRSARIGESGGVAGAAGVAADGA